MIHVSRKPYQPSEEWQKLSAQYALRPLARTAGTREAVSRVQKQLLAAGYNPGPVDGIWGPRTDAAFAKHVDALRPLPFEMFKGKCCYCEQFLDSERDSDLEHYRPKSTAMGLDGTTMKGGYWWLTTSWDNIYAACFECSRNKANRFPLVEESERAKSPGPHLTRERPLLLDPCSADPKEDPKRYLLFYFDGLVAPLKTAEELSEDGWHHARYGEDHHPGQITIDVLGLNRSNLVEARAQVAATLRELAAGQPPRRGMVTLEAIQEWYEKLVDPEAQFVALQRQLLRHLAEEHFAQSSSDSEFREQLETKKKKREQISAQQRDYQTDRSRASVEDSDSLVHFTTSARIRRIEIVNFRSIEDLEFELETGSTDRVGWKMLLGENGVGKSTVLQAVALVLMGKKNFDLLVAAGDLDPATLLRRGKGIDKGHVECALGADMEPRSMDLFRDGTVKFSKTARGRSRTVLLAFGSARWLYRPGGHLADKGDFVRVRNLFNPFVPLGDAVSWLHSLDQERFERVEEPLRRLLRLDEGERLKQVGERVLIYRPEVDESKWDQLTDLSDGYQTVLAMTGDIIELLSRTFTDIETAEGVVLIDEIGAHLHPRWRMRVVGQLREAFPHVQFIVTTHEPLCLRGLDEGEIMVMRRDEGGRIEAVTDLPSPAGFRVDQLLTSELFGLHSAVDPETERLFNEYYVLLATAGEEQRQAIESLEAQLRELRHLGASPREEIMYEVIDRLLARKRHVEPELGLEEIKEEAVGRIRELWRERFGGD